VGVIGGLAGDLEPAVGLIETAADAGRHPDRARGPVVLGLSVQLPAV
jgi:hypothetical protein